MTATANNLSFAFDDASGSLSYVDVPGGGTPTPPPTLPAPGPGLPQPGTAGSNYPTYHVLVRYPDGTYAFVSVPLGSSDDGGGYVGTVDVAVMASQLASIIQAERTYGANTYGIAQLQIQGANGAAATPADVLSYTGPAREIRIGYTGQIARRMIDPTDPINILTSIDGGWDAPLEWAADFGRYWDKWVRLHEAHTVPRSSLSAQSNGGYVGKVGGITSWGVDIRLSDAVSRWTAKYFGDPTAELHYPSKEMLVRPRRGYNFYGTGQTELYLDATGYAYTVLGVASMVRPWNGTPVTRAGVVGQRWVTGSDPASFSRKAYYAGGYNTDGSTFQWRWRDVANVLFDIKMSSSDTTSYYGWNDVIYAGTKTLHVKFALEDQFWADALAANPSLTRPQQFAVNQLVYIPCGATGLDAHETAGHIKTRVKAVDFTAGTITFDDPFPHDVRVRDLFWNPVPGVGEDSDSRYSQLDPENGGVVNAANAMVTRIDQRYFADGDWTMDGISLVGDPNGTIQSGIAVQGWDHIALGSIVGSRFRKSVLQLQAARFATVKSLVQYGGLKVSTSNSGRAIGANNSSVIVARLHSQGAPSLISQAESSGVIVIDDLRIDDTVDGGNTNLPYMYVIGERSRTQVRRNLEIQGLGDRLLFSGGTAASGARVDGRVIMRTDKIVRSAFAYFSDSAYGSMQWTSASGAVVTRGFDPAVRVPGFMLLGPSDDKTEPLPAGFLGGFTPSFNLPGAADLSSVGGVWLSATGATREYTLTGRNCTVTGDPNDSSGGTRVTIGIISPGAGSVDQPLVIPGGNPGGTDFVATIINTAGTSQVDIDTPLPVAMTAKSARIGGPLNIYGGAQLEIPPQGTTLKDDSTSVSVAAAKVLGGNGAVHVTMNNGVPAGSSLSWVTRVFPFRRDPSGGAYTQTGSDAPASSPNLPRAWQGRDGTVVLPTLPVARRRSKLTFPASTAGSWQTVTDIMYANVPTGFWRLFGLLYFQGGTGADPVLRWNTGATLGTDMLQLGVGNGTWRHAGPVLTALANATTAQVNVSAQAFMSGAAGQWTPVPAVAFGTVGATNIVEVALSGVLPVTTAGKLQLEVASSDGTTFDLMPSSHIQLVRGD